MGNKAAVDRLDSASVSKVVATTVQEAEADAQLPISKKPPAGVEPATY
jgi:hypothetical protein